MKSVANSAVRAGALLGTATLFIPAAVLGLATNTLDTFAPAAPAWSEKKPHPLLALLETNKEIREKFGLSAKEKLASLEKIGTTQQEKK